MKLDPIKLVSWDLDGTLYSIRRMKWHLIRMLLKEIAAGRVFLAHQELSLLENYRAKIDAARLAGGALGTTGVQDVNRDEILNVERRWYGRAISQAGLRPGVRELMSFFETRNVPQVLFSDYAAQYKLEALGLKGRFAKVYEGEQLGFVKPSPKLFERMAIDFGIPIEDLLHLGDRPDRDEVAARAAGCRCLILGRDFRSFRSLLDEMRCLI